MFLFCLLLLLFLVVDLDCNRENLVSINDALVGTAAAFAGLDAVMGETGLGADLGATGLGTFLRAVGINAVLGSTGLGVTLGRPAGLGGILGPTLFFWGLTGTGVSS